MRTASKATVKEVAAQAGVSLTTVHRALHGDGYVRPATRDKVLAAAAALAYRPNAVAQSLRRKRSGVIGHLVHMIYPNPYFACIAAGVEERARALGYATITCNTHSSIQLEQEYVEVLLRQQVEAVILTSPLREESVQRVRDSGTATCVVGRPLARIEVDSVTVDNRGGTRAGVTTLLELGHRAIAYVGTAPNDAVQRDRLDGYREALQACGVTPRPEWIRLPGFQREDGYRAMTELLALPAPPTAVLFAGDVPALGALQALWEEHRRVPDDLSIMSIDDTLAASASPPLTAMAIPLAELGATAVDLVVQRAGSQEQRPAQRVVLPMRLVLRASCQAVPVSHAAEPRLSSA